MTTSNPGSSSREGKALLGDPKTPLSFSRRRKKEKSRRGAEGAMSGDIRCLETSEPPGAEVSLGSGQQHWLPRGLLSAESESNGDSAR